MVGALQVEFFPKTTTTAKEKQALQLATVKGPDLWAVSGLRRVRHDAECGFELGGKLDFLPNHEDTHGYLNAVRGRIPSLLLNSLSTELHRKGSLFPAKDPHATGF